MKKNTIILILLCLVSFQRTNPLIIGSILGVSLESIVNFPQIDILADNIIRAFAWMKNGFTLQNSSTELSFESIFPVSGTVDLNGGELTLETDLIFKNVTTLNGLGVIFGQGHIIQFSTSILNLPADTESFEDTTLVFDGNINFLSDVLFEGNCAINANENTVNLANGSITITSGSQLLINNAKIAGIETGKIIFEDDTAELILDDVEWVQVDSYIFDTGVITFQDFVTFSGTGTFFYESSETSIIQEDSCLTITESLELSAGKHASSGNQPFEFSDKTSQLVLDSTAVNVTQEGIEFIVGSILFKRFVVFDIASTATIDFGNEMSADDITLQITPASTVFIKSGSVAYKNVNESKLLFGDQLSLIQFLSGSTLGLFQSMNIGNGIISFEDGTTIAKASGKDLIGSVNVRGDIIDASL